MPKGVTIIPMIILGLIFLQGLLNAISPKFLWKIFESWKATKNQSTVISYHEEYLVLSQC